MYSSIRDSVHADGFSEPRSSCFVPRRAALSLALGAFAAAILFYSSYVVRAQSPLDGFDPKANHTVDSIAVQADGKILVVGVFTTLSPNGGAAVTRNNIARLNPDGTLDASFNPNANDTVVCVAVQTDKKILIGGYFSSLTPNGGAAVPRNRIARLNADGTVDGSFNPNPNGRIQAITVQADGKILIGGAFTKVSPNGGPPVIRNRIARLNPDGQVDASFNPNANEVVGSIAVQADGRILIAGDFTTLSPNGAATFTRHHIARVNADGKIDVSFNPSADNFVLAIAVQADQKIIIGGVFTKLAPNGGKPVTRHRIARLNTDGKVDASFNPNSNNVVFSIAIQADGKILIGGYLTALSPNGGAALTRNHIARLNADGTVDASFNPNANFGVLSIATESDGKILIGGLFFNLSPNGGAAVPRNLIARLNLDGSLDQTLNLNFVGYIVYAIAVQSNGRTLIGGSFNLVLGVTRNNIARLKPDGTLDASFNPNANGDVDSIAVQANGKILIGGNFDALSPNGGAKKTRNHIARLNPDGTLDSFNPNAKSPTALDSLAPIAVQADGKILICGEFTSLSPNGGPEVPRKGIARLNKDGTLDSAFNPNPSNFVDPNYYSVLSIAVQADGKIVIGGAFNALSPKGGAPVTRNHIARLNKDGTVDISFDPNANGFIRSIAVQADGKILIGGTFTTLSPNGGAAVPRNRIARLSKDGTLDPSFNPNANSEVNSIAVQADGRILIGGTFNGLSPNGGAPVTRNCIARLNPDGTLDALFDPNANKAGLSVVVQADGKILIGGTFTALSPNGGPAVPRDRFARLTNDTAALQDLAVTQTTITWTRGGASPELSRATFEQSTGGGAFTFLGNGTRVGKTSNFTLTGLSLPTGQNILIRARGFYAAGNFNGSESITESVRNVYLF